jgi:hypothetical protein
LGSLPPLLLDHRPTLYPFVCPMDASLYRTSLARAHSDERTTQEKQMPPGKRCADQLGPAAPCKQTRFSRKTNPYLLVRAMRQTWPAQSLARSAVSKDFDSRSPDTPTNLLQAQGAQTKAAGGDDVRAGLVRTTGRGRGGPALSTASGDRDAGCGDRARQPQGSGAACQRL